MREPKKPLLFAGRRMMAGLCFLYLTLFVSDIHAQPDRKSQMPLMDIAVLTSECIYKNEEYEISFIAYSFRDILPYGSIILKDEKNNTLFEKDLSNVNKKWHKENVVLKDSRAIAYTLYYKDVKGNILDSESWSATYKPHYDIHVDDINSDKKTLGSIKIDVNDESIVYYDGAQAPAVMENLSPGEYELRLVNEYGCESKEIVVLGSEAKKNTKTLQTSTLTAAVIYEACENGDSVLLQVYDQLTSSTIVPSNGTYDLYQLTNPSNLSTAILRNEYLVKYGNSVYFKVDKRPGNYRILYTYPSGMTSPTGKTQLNARFDVQELNQQFDTEGGLFCINGGLITLAPNPAQGGTMIGTAIVDSLELTRNGVYSKYWIVDPSTFTLDQYYYYTFQYTQEQASGLMCMIEISDSLKVLPPPLIDITSFPDSSCFFESVTLNSLGTPEPGFDGLINYTWYRPDGSIFGTDSTATDSSASIVGYYKVIAEIVFDSFPLTCSDVDSAQVKLLELPEINMSTFGFTTCFGGSDGTVKAEILNGDPANYNFLWGNGSTADTLAGLSAGTYYVTVTDLLRGCENVDSVTISDPPIIEIVCDDFLIYPTCAEANNGIDSIVVTGGFPPYMYGLDDSINFQPNQVLTGIGKGDHVVYIMDSRGCIQKCPFFMPGPDTLKIEAGFSRTVSCFEEEDAIIKPIITGGTAPYNYYWPAIGSTLDSLPGVGVGVYTLEVTDSLGCFASLDIEVVQPEVLEPLCTISSTISCFGEADGEINTTIMGGTAPYRISWSPGDTITLGGSDTLITGLKEGLFTLTVIDANGCLNICTTDMVAPRPLECTIDAFELFCFGDTMGTLTAEVTGGTGPFRYLWNIGDTTPSITNLGIGTYSVTITDANGCITDCMTEVTQPDDLELSLILNDTIFCHGEPQGKVSTVITGGKLPYSIEWSRGDTTPMLTNVMAGKYIVKVTDKNGCMVLDSIILTEPPLLISSIVNDTLLCGGDMNGMLEVIPSGGTPPYRYLWNNGRTTQKISNLKAGKYTVTVTDSRDCPHTSMAMVVQPDTLMVGIKNRIEGNTMLCLDESMKIMANIKGGTQPYRVKWTLKSFDPSTMINDSYLMLTGDSSMVMLNSLDLCEGDVTIEISVTDDNGCEVIDEINIELKSCFDMAIRKTTSESLVNRGDTVRFKIEVFNQGTQDARQVEVTDNIPKGFHFIDTSADTVTPVQDKINYIWAVDSLDNRKVRTIVPFVAAGQKDSIYIDLKVPEMPVSFDFYNVAIITDFESTLNDDPKDEDDLDLAALPPGTSPQEKDDDVEDDSDGGEDNIFDEDREDFAEILLCEYNPAPMNLALCVSQDIINLWDYVPNSLSDGGTVLSYHADSTSAMMNEAGIDSVTVNSTIYARVMDPDGCIGVTTFNIALFNIANLIVTPQDIEVCPVEPVIFSVEAAGDSITYQWQANTGTNGAYVNIVGQTATTLNLGLYTPAIGSRLYRCVVTENVGNCIIETEPVRAIPRSCESILVCRGGININLDPVACSANIPLPNELLMVASPYPHEVRIYDQEGNEISKDSIDERYYGQTLDYRVYNLSTNQFCWGSIDITKKVIPPVMINDTTIVNCGTDLRKIYLTEQAIRDTMTSFCYADIKVLKRTETTRGATCDTLFTDIKFRATYVIDNETIDTVLATQLIIQLPLNLNDVICPQNTGDLELLCGQSADPDSIAKYFDDPSTPYYNEGIPFAFPYQKGDSIFVLKYNSPTDSTMVKVPHYINMAEAKGCNLIIDYIDVPFPTCVSGEGKIYREWSLYNWCPNPTGSGSKICSQTILFKDTIAPVARLKDTTISVINASIQPWTCTASVRLPDLHITDNCSSTFDIDWETTSGTLSDSLAMGLRMEDSPVTLTATVYDNCGQSTVVRVQVNILDNFKPVATCDDVVIVSVNPDLGIKPGSIKATAFNAGSHDGGCGPVTIKVIRMEDFESGPLRHPVTDDILRDSLTNAVAYPANNDCYKKGTFKITYTNSNKQVVTDSFDYVTFEDELTYCCTDIPSIQVVVQVSDQSGNTNQCMSVLQFKDAPLNLRGCTEDITLACGDPYAPEDIGKPEAATVCNSVSMDFTDTESIAGCSQLVTRVWKMGNQVVCTQYITLESKALFDPNTIKWPVHRDGKNETGTIIKCDKTTATGTINHYDDATCDDTLADDPVYTAGSCSTIASGYTDHFVESSLSPCGIIKRTWTVIDWCTYVPNTGTNKGDSFTLFEDECTGEKYYRYNNVNKDGFYSFDQYIHIAPSDNVINVSLSDVELATAVDAQSCTFEGQVNATFAVTCALSKQYKSTALSWSIEIVNTSTDNVVYAKSGTGKQVNESVSIEAGSDDHVLIVKVIDGCGQTATDTKTIKLTDNRQYDMICQERYINQVSLNESETYELQAHDIMISADAPCSGAFFFRNAAGQYVPSVTLDCEDFGEDSRYIGERTIYYVDGEVVKDSCQLLVFIELDEPCVEITTTSSNLVGRVKDLKKRGVEEVNVWLEQSKMFNTDAYGYYEVGALSDLGMQKPTIKPEKNSNPLNGVNVLDLILLKRHILGMEVLPTAYQIIAADVNNDQRVSGSDAVALQRTLIGYDDNFRNNTSWRFVPKDYKFVNEQSPFPFDEEISMKSTMKSVDFVGIKIGDLNNDAIANSFQTKKKSNNAVAQAKLTADPVSAQEVNLIVTMEGINNINGLLLNLDLEGLEVSSVQTDLLTISEGDWKVNNDNSLTIMWSSGAPVLYQSEILFTINCRKTATEYEVKAGQISSTLSEDGKTLKNVNVSMDEVDVSEEFLVGQNRPNPFQDKTTIDFSLPEAGLLEYSILDNRGKIYYIDKKNLQAGDNTVSIDNKILTESGIYYVRFAYRDAVRVVKILKL